MAFPARRDVLDQLRVGPQLWALIWGAANLAVLLQTLDADGDHTNGIEIQSEIAALFEDAVIEVDQPGAAFQADTELQAAVDEANSRDLFSGDRTIVQRADALRALYIGLGLCPSGS